MHDSIIHAPLTTDPHTILDIGCGPGDVSREFAARFPKARVYGIDLSVLPEHDNPRQNLTYIHGDIMQLLRAGDVPLAPESVDYAFGRLLVCGMTEWPEYIRMVAGAVRGGGWVEMHDWDQQVWEDGRNVSDEWPWLQAIIKHGWEQKKLDLRCSQKLKGWMEAAGLVDVQEVRYRAPLGLWDVEEHPETKKMAEMLAKWWPSVNWLMIPSLTRGGVDERRVEEMKAQMLKDLDKAQAEQKKSYEIVVCYGRKP